MTPLHLQVGLSYQVGRSATFTVTVALLSAVSFLSCVTSNVPTRRAEEPARSTQVPVPPASIEVSRDDPVQECSPHTQRVTRTDPVRSESPEEQAREEPAGVESVASSEEHLPPERDETEFVAPARAEGAAPPEAESETSSLTSLVPSEEIPPADRMRTADRSGVVPSEKDSPERAGRQDSAGQTRPRATKTRGTNNGGPKRPLLRVLLWGSGAACAAVLLWIGLVSPGGVRAYHRIRLSRLKRSKQRIERRIRLARGKLFLRYRNELRAVHGVSDEHAMLDSLYMHRARMPGATEASVRRLQATVEGLKAQEQWLEQKLREAQERFDSAPGWGVARFLWQLWREGVRAKRLPPDKAAEVEDSIDFLSQRESERQLSRAATRLSEDAFRKVWDNPDDADYDRL